MLEPTTPKASNVADDHVIKGKPWMCFPPLSPRRLSWLMVSTYETVRNMEKYWKSTNRNQTSKQRLCDEELETTLMKFTFPLDSEENLEALEHSLQGDNNLRKALVEQLYLTGGKPWLHMVFHIMDFLISKEIGKLFTYGFPFPLTN